MADNGGVHIGPWKETDMLSGDLGGDQGLFREERTRRGYGGPWKETDMLSRDQEVVHPITCMYNFLVSTKEAQPRKGGQPGSFVLMGNCMGGKLPPGIHVSNGAVWNSL